MNDKLEYLLDRCVMEKGMADMYKGWYEQEKEKMTEAEKEIKGLKQDLKQSQEMHDIVHTKLLKNTDECAALKASLAATEIILQNKDEIIEHLSGIQNTHWQYRYEPV